MTAAHPPARLDGLDLARFVAFAGMVTVNFRLVISGDGSGGGGLPGALVSMLEGRAAATFVVLAGLGLGLAGRRDGPGGVFSVTLKRAAFLLALGLANMLIFDADILHYYAFYFLIGAPLLRLGNRGLFAVIVLLNALAVLLALTLDYDAEWDWSGLVYAGFWTPEGFIRNLFFNGWHPVIPWLGFLLFGFMLSRLDLIGRRTQLRLCGAGLAAIAGAELAAAALAPRLAAIDPALAGLATTAAMPPMPLYILAGTGAAAAVIGFCLLAGDRLAGWGVTALLAPAGRQSLTLYMAHIVLGMGTLDTLGLLGGQPVTVSLAASLIFCILAVVYARLWSARFRHGPVEALMRKLAG